jgi:hypothetical protein
LDSLFLGVIEATILTLLGRGGWYTSPPSGERIVYQGRHGVLFGGIDFTMPNRVVVSDKRFTMQSAGREQLLSSYRRCGAIDDARELAHRVHSRQPTGAGGTNDAPWHRRDGHDQ